MSGRVSRRGRPVAVAFWTGTPLRRAAPDVNAYRSRLVVAALGLCSLVHGAGEGHVATASFTDSQSRTVLFRYELADAADADVPHGVLVFFHGNNTGTRESVVNAFFPQVRRHAAALGLVPVALGSPRAYASKLAPSIVGLGIREWQRADQDLVHEMLQRDFGGHIRVDRDRVFLWGVSQGACFLNEFVPRHGMHYGGGLLAQCGCFNEANPVWSPPAEFRNRFRVLVQATTGDFLYPHTLDAYGYYRYAVGLDTRGDLAGAGGHCAAGEVSDSEALRWLVDGTGLADDPDVPHATRVSAMDHVAGLSVDEEGGLWIVRQAPGVGPTLWHSNDRGRTIAPVTGLDVRVGDLDAVGGTLFITHPRPLRVPPFHRHALHRSTDGGRTFEVVPVAGSTVRGARLLADRRSRLFFPRTVASHNDVLVSNDLGDTWSPLGLDGAQHERFVNADPIVTEGAAAYLFTGVGSRVSHVGTLQGGDWTEVSPAAGETVYSMAWDGNLFWGSGSWSRLYTSTDRGRTWFRAPWPAHAEGEFAAVINALGHGQVLVSGSYGDGHLRDRGVWTRIHGTRAVKEQLDPLRIAIDHAFGDVYLTGKHGIFRLDAAQRAIDLPAPPADTDGDGIRDALDRFPFDPHEYLDTDDDGIGNGADPDADDDGVLDRHDAVPLDARDASDLDGDGVGDSADVDDDGDEVPDGLDAFPKDRSRWADADGDGLDDLSDPDDDGDGTADVDDAFPYDARETADFDGDGVGDNLDVDDDNDGRDDAHDPAPRAGRSVGGLRLVQESYGATVFLELNPEPGPGIVYPLGQGTGQHYGAIELVADSFAFMIDDFGGYARIHVDRNGNRDLTDDGPPALAEDAAEVRRWVDVRYPSGLLLPHALTLRVGGLDPSGRITRMTVSSETSWRGRVQVHGGRKVAVATFDYDGDGMFTGERDYQCIDVVGSLPNMAYCYSRPSAYRSGDTFLLDGQAVQVRVAASGQHVEIGAPGHRAPFVPAASHPEWQGLVRVRNRSDRAGDVLVRGFDDTGDDYGPVAFHVTAGATREFDSADIEQGNPARGLPRGIGTGTGDWRVHIESGLDLDVLSYVRTADGFLTSMHDEAVRDDFVMSVPSPDPGRGRGYRPMIRLLNPSNAVADVSIRGIDDAGRWAAGTVRVTVPPRGARTLTVAELETGGEGVDGSLGEGAGGWRLEIACRTPLHAMSLLRSPGGHLTNLSTPPYEDGGPRHHIDLFPQATDPLRKGIARVVNRSASPGFVHVFGYDRNGARRGPAVLRLDPLATVQLDSSDIEDGNAAKRLTAGIGPGVGAWRLELVSPLELDVLGYVQSTGGLLASMHDAFHLDEAGILVPTVNPGSSFRQSSLLRLINPSGEGRRLVVTGFDDAGSRSGSVRIRVPPRATRTYSTLQLETGFGDNVSGALGEGDGKWRLEIAADGPVRAMSLLQSPAGHFTNLSTMPPRFPSRRLVRMNRGTQALAGRAPAVHGDAAAPDRRHTTVRRIDTERFGTVHFDMSLLDGRRTEALGDEE